MDTFKYLVLIVTFAALVCVQQNNPEAALGDACSDSNECTTPNAECNGSNCICSQDYYQDENICSSTVFLKPTIQDTSTSTHNSVTLIWSRNVATGYTNSYNVKYSVLNGPVQNHAVTEDVTEILIDGLSSGTTYNFVVVRTITGGGRTQPVADSDGKQFTTNGDYGDSCPTPGNVECRNGLACVSSVNMCLCADGLYYVGTSCIATDSLKPTILDTSTSTHNSVTLKWSRTEAINYTNSYNVKYNDQSHDVTGDVTETTINSLSAGTTYNFVVVRSITREGRTQPVADSDGKPFTTNGVYGDSCPTPGNVECRSGLACVSSVNKCLCADGLYYVGTSCIATVSLKPTILDTSTSTRNSVTLKWSRTVATGYTNGYNVKYNVLSGDVQNHAVTENDATETTINGLSFGTTYNFVVVRTITREGRTQPVAESDGKQFTTYRDYGDSCPTPGTVECRSGLTCVLSVNKCLCPDGSYYVGTSCISTVSLKPTILDNSTSTHNSVTLKWSSPDASGYTNSYIVKYNDQSHTVTGDVTETTINSLSSGSTYNFVLVRTITREGRTQPVADSDGKPFTTKRDYAATCTDTAQCRSGLSCVVAGSVKRCLCPNGFYRNTQESCVSINGLKPHTVKTSFGTSIVNITWISPSAVEYTNNYMIKYGNINTGDLGDVSRTSISGLTPGSSYTFTVSRSITRHDRTQTIDSDPTGGTAPKIRYGDVCTVNNTCMDTNTNCYSAECRCDSRYYRNTQANSCQTIEDLRPNTVTVQVTGTTTMSVTWTSLDHNVITGYDVTTSPIETGHNVVVAGKTATITGLTPGKLYTVSVKTKITYLVGRNEMTSATNASPQRTIPEMVTRLDDTLTNLTAPVITIVFPNPVGDKTSYNVNLVGIKGDTGYTQTNRPSYTHPSSTTSTTFSGVVASYEYRLTITTNSGGILSASFTRNIKVKDKPAGEVHNFNKTEPTSRSVNVSWQRPRSPNGDLYQYTLEIMEDSNCKQLVIFDCTNCSTNRSSEPNPTCDKSRTETIPEAAVTDDNYVINYTISTLLPSITYVLSVAAYNGEGKGMGKTLNVLTMEEAAGVPTDFDSTTQTASSITVTWNPPLPRPGNTFYNLTVYEWNEATRNFDFYNLTYFTDYESREFTIDGLSSYWNYSFTIQANTSKGASDIVNLPGSVRTKQSPPIQVEYIRISKIPEVFNRVRVEWKCPEGKDTTNGPITNANVTYKIEEPTVDQTMSGSVKYPNPGNCLWEKEVTVTPEYNYTFTVFLINEFPGIERTTYRYIPAGPPDLTSTVVDVSAGQSETSVSILIFPSALHNGKNGRVILTGVVVCKGTCQTRKRRDAKDRSYYDSLPTWKQSKADNFVSPYRATPDNWIDDKKTTDRLDFKVGNDSSCNSAPDNVFCNGQLPRGTSFTIYVFACTDVGCSDSASIKVDTMETPTNIGLIAGVVGGVVAAIIIIIIVVLVVRYMRRPQTTKLDPEDTEEELIVKKRPTRICNFEKKVEEMHKDSNLLFSEEFEDINALSPKHPCVASETGGNKLKNRYVNILPFDHSRVKLLPTEEDEEETDYINGNYIPGYRSQREYIATQGPMTGTVNDFWRMIWEQNVPIIVMLSDLSEKGKPKVDRYYPENMEPVQYGDIIVEMTNFSPLNKYVIRIFKLQLGDEIRMVRHYFLPGWQDFGANLTSDDVINFLKSVRMEIKPNNQGPLCIHCSAGVGRTGTYITLDVFQQYIDEEDMNKEMDIFDFTMKMRNNRSYMIQTEKQYIFVHDTIKEMIIRKKKEMSERDHIYQNHNTDDNNVYENQAFEADPQDIYMNVDSTGKPTTAL